MSDILSIGAGATQLYRQSLATVSNNIANLNTEGYSRQVSSSAEGMPSEQGTVFIGTGARLQGVTRAYDEFIEGSLRNSSSDLSTQEPMIEYANRIIDLMGSQTSGLSSAMDKFFATASDLSADPASTVQRNMFVRDAEGLASRFRELAGHLSAIEVEAQSSIKLQVSTINTLSAQLATINTQLGGKIAVDKQPAGLLDQRDQVLRDLANISKIHIDESPSGEVNVRLGSSAGSLLVEGKKSLDLGVSFDANDPGRVDIVLDPFGEPRAASTVTSGVLGGLINFRSQTLGPAMDGFDYLAQTVVKEINQIHTSGLDARGVRGTDLFKIDSVFDVTSPAVNTNANLDIEVIDPAAFKFSPFEVRWMGTDQVWRIEDGKTGAVTFATPGADGFSHSGLQINASGRVNDGDTFKIEPRDRPAAGFRLSQTDPLAIAAAERLRVMASEANVSDSKVSLSYDQPLDFTGFNTGTDIYTLGNNANIAAGIATTASHVTPAFIIPKGADKVALMMEVPQDSNLRFQVMTHEGVHVLGHGIDTDTQAALMSGDAAFSAADSYSSTYLNAVGTDAYQDLDMTYGFLASSITQDGFVPNAEGTGMQARTTTINAQVLTAPVRLQNNVSGSTVDVISADSLVLNGQPMAALTLASSTQSSAASMASWLNGATSSTGVTATASTVIKSSATDIDLTQQVRINGVLVGAGSYPANIDALSVAINAQTSITNVAAYVDRDGGLVVTNALGHEGKNIILSNPDASSANNALGQSNQTYVGTLQLDSSDKVRFTFGASGQPADLAVLGLRTGIYMNGAPDEDMAVFVTGTGSANIAAGFAKSQTASQPADDPQLRVDFSSATRYSITDTATNTVVANRSYTAGDDIHYKSLTLSFDSAPVSGDRYVVDSNQDGIGNNGNMLTLVALQDKPVLANGRTLSEGYIDLVSTVGNKATLAKISQDALQVVYDQAVQSKDQVSGVSLDQEAADLIRLQQAYQASAQIIQMSSKIFDSILGIR
jgi:flagellar hook-associated protein FlgK